MAFNWFKKDKKEDKAVEVLSENSIILGAEAKDKYEAIEIVGIFYCERERFKIHISMP